MTKELLAVTDLRMHYAANSTRPVRAIDGVSLSVSRGEVLGVVGESGCGKSSLALALMGILPARARVVGGTIVLEGRELVALSDEQMNAVRWDQIAMVFQGAMNALNPVRTVGRQLVEPAMRLYASRRTSRQAAIAQAEELLNSVDLLPEVMKRYPHELSGGMKQRVIIAMSLMCSPSILVADEPTTALDVIAQDRVLGLLDRVRRERDLAVVLISHDIGVILETCHRIAVMYAGQIVETGSIAEVFSEPKHPYTRALLSSVPSLRGDRRKLRGIKGEPPSMVNPPRGCRFAARCEFATEACLQSSNVDLAVSANHSTKCVRVEDLQTLFGDRDSHQALGGNQ